MNSSAIAGWGLSLAMTACANTAPNFDRQFGSATREAISMQIADPDAAQRHEGNGPQTIEGRVAGEVINRYYKSFAEPPTPGNVFNIGLSAGDSGSGASHK